ncbi:E3 ubiquitin-protein ligase RNF180-like [Ostrea edulis]|uniref:E3 ubiquitin-protein ligase RNF180-like n=1 Tax=Ostrea edulis TaxID=37623 RepID=UPI0024AEC659|nr:E3 ubiquitin-protein ligase RNF180-like [Ostrea edulis]XP_048763383.2 E3 ubiquitin-protein ligase RNF180-like [Ostrea edulis]
MTHYRCRKCSYYLFTDDCIITEHGQKDEVCPATVKSLATQWFLNYEDQSTPQWVSEVIREGFLGIKGKLCCPKCQGRIGSFDLPARKLCPCEQFMLPAVHVLCSRVDKITVTGNQDIAVLRQRMAVPHRRNNTVPGQSSSVVGAKAPETAEMDSTDFISNTASAVSNMSHQNTADCSSERESGSEQMFIQRRSLRHRRLRKRKLLLPEDLEEQQLPVCRNRFEALEQEAVKENEAGVRESVHEKEAVEENFHMSEWDLSVESTVSEDHCCAVCLDLYCRPMICRPCNHKYCEPCLRRLASGKRYRTQCPMCRAVITCCNTDRELETQMKDLYPEHYRNRLRKEQKICSNRKYPLPTASRHPPRRPRTDISAISSSQMICLALILITAILIILTVFGMLFAVFKVLTYFIHFLMYFLDYANITMAVYDLMF